MVMGYGRCKQVSVQVLVWLQIHGSVLFCQKIRLNLPIGIPKPTTHHWLRKAYENYCTVLKRKQKHETQTLRKESPKTRMNRQNLWATCSVVYLDIDKRLFFQCYPCPFTYFTLRDPLDCEKGRERKIRVSNQISPKVTRFGENYKWTTKDSSIFFTSHLFSLFSAHLVIQISRRTLLSFLFSTLATIQKGY